MDHESWPVEGKRILFFAEAVTLAHVARPIALARGLDEAGCVCTIACDRRYGQFLRDGPWRHVHVDSVPTTDFLRALSRGNPVYDLPTLRRYLRDDLALIEEHKPDVVVGDFRLSLSVSARLARIPYVAISNAYWSPYYARARVPLPVLPMTRFLPIPVAQALFAVGRPLAFPLHCRPMNQLRVEHGLASLGYDLRRVYTDADRTLYADDPQLFPLRDAPESHRAIGAVLWEPDVAPPAWWDDVPTERPIVYVTLGSSGPAGALERVLDAAGRLPVTVIASTAGSPVANGRRANAFLAPYLPGTAAAKRSALVVCNGGSLTCYQALAAGVPLIGIASNLDQFLNMDGLHAAGLAQLLRADRLSPSLIANSIARALEPGPVRLAAQRARDQLKLAPTAAILEAIQ